MFQKGLIMKTLIVVVVLVVAGIVGVGFYRGWFLFESQGTKDKPGIAFSVDNKKLKSDKDAANKKMKELGQQVTGQPAKSSSMDGTVVSVEGDQLAMTNSDGKEHSHPLAAGVKMTCDGKVCTAADLKSGMKIRVTINSDAPNAVTHIEALDENPEFEKAG
jgi:hypothetical protein